jgi:hypothetical protein
MYCAVLPRLGSLGHEGERGRLKWAQLRFQLHAREGTDVAAGCKFIIDSGIINIRQLINRRVIWGGESGLDLQDAEIEAKLEAIDHKWIFVEEVQARELFSPRVVCVRGDGFTPSLLKGMSGLRVQLFRIRSICAACCGVWIGSPWEAAS